MMWILIECKLIIICTSSYHFSAPISLAFDFIPFLMTLVNAVIRKSVYNT